MQGATRDSKTDGQCDATGDALSYSTIRLAILNFTNPLFNRSLFTNHLFNIFMLRPVARVGGAGACFAAPAPSLSVHREIAIFNQHTGAAGLLTFSTIR